MGAEPSSRVTHSEAILAVIDVRETIRFYRDVLGFEREWLWGDPPTFGGVRWGKANVMLCQQPELAKSVEGHQHWFGVEDVDGLYQQHKAKGATIISGIDNKPWGAREYTVRDINGYHLRFGGEQSYRRPATALSTLPGHIQIAERMPTPEEFCNLAKAVGWNQHVESVPVALKNSLFGVVALDTRAKADNIVGAARVVGDGARFFYVQDVMVMPEYQNRRIGSAMMETVMRWLKGNAPQGASSIGLFTGKPAFYERFGFQSGNGMSMGL